MSKVREIAASDMIARVEEMRAEIEAGKKSVPWKKLFRGANGMPANLVSNRPYRGWNVFALALQGYDSPYWLTFNQLKKLGGRLKKTRTVFVTGPFLPTEGLHIEVPAPEHPAVPVLFWKFPTEADKQRARQSGKREPGVLERFYKVINTDLCEGLDDHIRIKAMAEGTESRVTFTIEACEDVYKNFPNKPEVRFGGGQAYYAPSSDRVQLPHQHNFANDEAYYATMFHELVHSTGHMKRLNRDEVVNPITFGNHEYSIEELTAEMGAAILSAMTGVDSEKQQENMAAYLTHWLSKIKKDPGLLIGAAQKAQKAVDHIVSYKYVAETKPKADEVVAAEEAA